MSSEYDDLIAHADSIAPQASPPKPLTDLEKVRQIIADREAKRGGISVGPKLQGTEPNSMADYIKALGYGAASQGAPGAISLAGALGAKLGGGNSAEGYFGANKEANDTMGRHPVLSTIGGIAGGAVSPLYRSINGIVGAGKGLTGLLGKAAGGAFGAGVTGAAMGESAQDALDRGKSSAIVGGAVPIAMAAGNGLANYAAGSRNRLIDMFGQKGAALMDKAGSAPYEADANPGIGGPAGPKSMPELKTSSFMRSPQENSLAGLKKGGSELADLAGTPKAATKQLMGPEFMEKRVGVALANPGEKTKLLEGISKVAKYGGQDVNPSQAEQNWLPSKMNGLNNESKVHELVSNLTGEDAVERAQRGYHGAIRADLGSPTREAEIALHRPTVQAFEEGQLNRLGKPKMIPYMNPKNSTNPEWTSGGTPSGTVKGGAGVQTGGPIPVSPEDAGRMVQDPQWLNSGKAIKSVKWSGFDPQEADLYGKVANKTQAINMGRDASGGLSSMLSKGAMMLHQPKLALAAQTLGPTAAELRTGLTSKAGLLGGKVLKMAGGEPGTMFDKWMPQNKVVSAFNAGMTPALNKADHEEEQATEDLQ